MKLENAVIYGGVDGTRQAIVALRSMRNMLAGHSENINDISVKWDGCVAPDTLILTSIGPMAIGEYISRATSDDGNMRPAVLARNIDENVDVMAAVTGYSIEDGSKDWVEVHLENGTSLKLTRDHEVYLTSGEWVPAGDLKEGDDIYQLK